MSVSLLVGLLPFWILINVSRDAPCQISLCWLNPIAPSPRNDHNITFLWPKHGSHKILHISSFWILINVPREAPCEISQFWGQGCLFILTIADFSKPHYRYLGFFQIPFGMNCTILHDAWSFIFVHVYLAMLGYWAYLSKYRHTIWNLTPFKTDVK